MANFIDLDMIMAEVNLKEVMRGPRFDLLPTNQEKEMGCLQYTARARNGGRTQSEGCFFFLSSDCLFSPRLFVHYIVYSVRYKTSVSRNIPFSAEAKSSILCLVGYQVESRQNQFVAKVVW